MNSRSDAFMMNSPSHPIFSSPESCNQEKIVPVSQVRELEEETDMRFREMSTTTGLMPGGSVLALPLFSGLTARNKKARDVAVNLSFSFLTASPIFKDKCFRDWPSSVSELRASYWLTLDLWLAKDNRFLIPDETKCWRLLKLP